MNEIEKIQRLNGIKLIVSDVDGTLTDGRIFINGDGSEAKCFSAHDGLASNLWVKLGGKIALLTGRGESETVSRRAREMKCCEVVFGKMDKDAAIHQICGNAGVTLEQTLYVGDDLPDILAMKFCGLGAAVKNAAPEVQSEADILLECSGGDGALRELIELVLKTQNRWQEALAQFLKQQHY